MRSLNSNPNVDNSDLVNYPDGRIKDNTGVGDGTPVDERTKGDFHQMLQKLMRLYAIVPNNLPDNEANGFQLIDALRALATKNDFVIPLTTVSGVLNVGLKLNLLLDGEAIIVKASSNWTTETQIKGSDNATFNFVKVGNFKANDYVRLIKGASNVTLVRLGDAGNIDTLVSELLYLKKASQAQENAGAVDTVATTPLVNKVTFERRVNGVDSASYLATELVNGLLSKEDKVKLNVANKTLNIGFGSGIDLDSGPIGTAYAVGGNLVSCTLTAKTSNSSTIRVVVQNAMSGVNYYVRTFIQSQSANIASDNAFGSLVFKPINSTTFDINIREFASQTQNLKIHFEVVNI